MNDRMRQRIQRRIILRIVSDALAGGYSISVQADGDTLVSCSTDRLAIMSTASRYSPDSLLIHSADDEADPGRVEFDYANEPWDVINDFSCNIEDAVRGAKAAARTLEEIYA
jgi:hypothetical protein